MWGFLKSVGSKVLTSLAPRVLNGIATGISTIISPSAADVQKAVPQTVGDITPQQQQLGINDMKAMAQEIRNNVMHEVMQQARMGIEQGTNYMKRNADQYLDNVEQQMSTVRKKRKYEYNSDEGK